MRFVLILPVLMALGACQFALPGGAGKTVANGAEAQAKPITGDDISVTSLDAPSPGDGADASAPAQPTATPLAAAPAQEDAPAATSDAAEVAPDAAPEAVPEKPAEVKSQAHLLCEKKGGVWSNVGSTFASFCQTPTRDGGKSCRKESDCEGYCLAKSGTCAPIAPLFGCNDILTEEGRMLTQCIN